MLGGTNQFPEHINGRRVIAGNSELHAARFLLYCENPWMCLFVRAILNGKHQLVQDFSIVIPLR